MNKTWRVLIREASANVEQSVLLWWLSDTLDRPLTQLPLDKIPDPETLRTFESVLPRLAAGEPVQYICGRAPFRDLELKVDSRVLIPRPETEQLVQIALDRLLPPGAAVLDLGTGSGCIALALKHERPDCRVEGVDLSPDAVALARENAERLNLDVPFRQQDLLSGEPFRNWKLLIANLPYIGEKEAPALPSTVRDFEPPMALFSGPEGTDLILRLLQEAQDFLAPGGQLLLETGETQGAVWKQAADAWGWEIRGLKDLAGRERFWIFST